MVGEVFVMVRYLGSNVEQSAGAKAGIGESSGNLSFCNLST